METIQGAREKLIKTLKEQIVPNLKCRLWDYEFPMEFIIYHDIEIKELILNQPTETIQFGALVNKMRKEFYRTREERQLVEVFWNAFWWPAVDRLWHLQCFEMNGEEKNINHIFLFARICEGDISEREWIGVQSKICYTPQ